MKQFLTLVALSARQNWIWILLTWLACVMLLILAHLSFYGSDKYAAVFALLEVLLGIISFFIVVTYLLTDPIAGSRSQWHTRPIHPLMLGASRIFGVYICFSLPVILYYLIINRIYDLPTRCSLGNLFKELALIASLGALAIASRTIVSVILKGVCIGLIAIVVWIFALINDIDNNWLDRSPYITTSDSTVALIFLLSSLTAFFSFIIWRKQQLTLALTIIVFALSYAAWFFPWLQRPIEIVEFGDSSTEKPRSEDWSFSTVEFFYETDDDDFDRPWITLEASGQPPERLASRIFLLDAKVNTKGRKHPVAEHPYSNSDWICLGQGGDGAIKHALGVSLLDISPDLYFTKSRLQLQTRVPHDEWSTQDEERGGLLQGSVHIGHFDFESVVILPAEANQMTQWSPGRSARIHSIGKDATNGDLKIKIRIASADISSPKEPLRNWHSCATQYLYALTDHQQGLAWLPKVITPDSYSDGTSDYVEQLTLTYDTKKLPTDAQLILLRERLLKATPVQFSVKTGPRS